MITRNELDLYIARLDPTDFNSTTLMMVKIKEYVDQLEQHIKSLEAQLANTEQLTCDKNKNCINCYNLKNGYCIIFQRKMTSDINSINKSHWLKSISCNDFKLKYPQ